MSLMINNNDRALEMYQSLMQNSKETEKISLIVVQHVVPNTLPFFRSINKAFHVACVIPKPKSINSATMDFLEQSDDRLKIMHITRKQSSDQGFLKEHVFTLVPDENKVVILDVGGYFSEAIDVIYEWFGDRFIGIVEDTENGHQKYQSALDKKNNKLPFPIFSVARSPLKEPEDYLVGQSIVYSIERILRENSTLLTNKKSLVIGYGKIGKSVANSLSARNISVCIHDHDPIRKAQALAHGYSTPNREEAISSVDLIVGASGNCSLALDDFENLKDNCFVASVTSGDDEFEMDKIKSEYRCRDNKNSLSIYYCKNKTFFMMNDGNAVNFTYSNVLGPYIYLVACEILFCVNKLLEGNVINTEKINSLNTLERRKVADVWVRCFGNGK